MRLGAALFVAYFLIFIVCISYPIAHIAGNMRTRYLEGAEEPLVDQANILAEIVGHEMETGDFDPQSFFRVFQDVYARTLSARIYELEKRRVDVRVYITDAEGKVVFDSERRDIVGEDYRDWRDVRLTLEGTYGARTTQDDPNEPATSVLYVGAPIRAGGRIAGVLTVAEPTSSINAFLESAKPDLFRIGILWGLVALILSSIVSLWVSGQIGRLISYANATREGRRVELPRLAPTELRQMGEAFDRMRESLEGKKYVEHYVQTLTHEIKSPVSAILGAAEILEEEMPPESRSRFLSNIRNEAGRIQDLVERMLKLSELESRKALETMEDVHLSRLVREALESVQHATTRKRLRVDLDLTDDLVLRGDPFLLRQAVSNLLQNAVDFSPPSGRIFIRASADRAMASLVIEDEGPGIPEYAKQKVFEKFFSLKRPDTGKKSTGLGLNFVQEVASLHEGEIALENLGKGLRVSLAIPIRRRGDRLAS